MLKGSARIELTDADGSKKVVEHGNMITDAVNDLLYAPRGEMSNIMRISNNNDSYIAQMFGGILLFEDTLNNDAADYYIPNLKITGYASQDAYNGLDIARGSFNQPESGLQADGSYKLVWDFSTSQANGVIKSLGLCPNIMGQIGASNSVVASERKGFTIDKSSVDPFNQNQYMIPSDGTTANISNHYFNLVAVIGNIAYAVNRNNLYCDNNDSTQNIMYNGGVLKLYRFNIATEGVCLSNVIGMATYIDCIDVQLPTDFLSVLSNNKYSWTVSHHYNDKDKKLIIYPCENSSELSKNDTTKYVEIELTNNMNVTTYTFTNNAGTIQRNHNKGEAYDYGGNSTFYVMKDYVVTVATSDGLTKLYTTKKSDNTDVKVAKDSSGNDFTFSSSSVIIRYVYEIGNLFVFGIAESDVSTNFTNTYIFDMSTGLIKETNARDLTCRSNVPLMNKATWAKTGAYLGLKIAVCPFILTTKNNLDAPVTKTASQTMKITYTLKESEA